MKYGKREAAVVLLNVTNNRNNRGCRIPVAAKMACVGAPPFDDTSFTGCHGQALICPIFLSTQA